MYILYIGFSLTIPNFIPKLINKLSSNLLGYILALDILSYSIIKSLTKHFIIHYFGFIIFNL